MKIERVFMSGAAWRRQFWDRVDRIATVAAWVLVAAAAGAAAILWLAWLVAGVR